MELGGDKIFLIEGMQLWNELGVSLESQALEDSLFQLQLAWLILL